MKNYRPPLLFPRFWRASECDVLGASAPVVPDEKKSAPAPPHRRPTRGSSYRASNAVFVWATKADLLSNYHVIPLLCSLNSPAALSPSPCTTNTCTKRSLPFIFTERHSRPGRWGGGVAHATFGEAKYRKQANKKCFSPRKRTEIISTQPQGKLTPAEPSKVPPHPNYRGTIQISSCSYSEPKGNSS